MSEAFPEAFPAKLSSAAASILDNFAPLGTFPWIHRAHGIDIEEPLPPIYNIFGQSPAQA